MIKITEDQVEQLGRIADKAANLAEASKMRLPAQMHVEALSGGMREIRDELRAIVVEVSGENPWELEPDDSGGGAGGS